MLSSALELFLGLILCKMLAQVKPCGTLDCCATLAFVFFPYLEQLFECHVDLSMSREIGLITIVCLYLRTLGSLGQICSLYSLFRP